MEGFVSLGIEEEQVEDIEQYYEEIATPANLNKRR